VECRLRSYLDTAAPHGITALDSIISAITKTPGYRPPRTRLTSAQGLLANTRMVTESGLSPVTLHGLGHGAATLALAVGAAGLAVLDAPDRSGFRLTYHG
jgi:hypothetical protein